MPTVLHHKLSENEIFLCILKRFPSFFYKIQCTVEVREFGRLLVFRRARGRGKKPGLLENYSSRSGKRKRKRQRRDGSLG